MSREAEYLLRRRKNTGTFLGKRATVGLLTVELPFLTVFMTRPTDRRPSQSVNITRLLLPYCPHLSPVSNPSPLHNVRWQTQKKNSTDSAIYHKCSWTEKKEVVLLSWRWWAGREQQKDGLGEIRRHQTDRNAHNAGINTLYSKHRFLQEAPAAAGALLSPSGGSHAANLRLNSPASFLHMRNGPLANYWTLNFT